MDDLVIKMESIFGVKRFIADQPLQYVVSPSDLVNDLINFLPQIVQFFIQVLSKVYANTKSTNCNIIWTISSQITYVDSSEIHKSIVIVNYTRMN